MLQSSGLNAGINFKHLKAGTCKTLTGIPVQTGLKVNTQSIPVTQKPHPWKHYCQKNLQAILTSISLIFFGYFMSSFCKIGQITSPTVSGQVEVYTYFVLLLLCFSPAFFLPIFPHPLCPLSVSFFPVFICRLLAFSTALFLSLADRGDKPFTTHFHFSICRGLKASTSCYEHTG